MPLGLLKLAKARKRKRQRVGKKDAQQQGGSERGKVPMFFFGRLIFFLPCNLISDPRTYYPRKQCWILRRAHHLIRFLYHFLKYDATKAFPRYVK